MVWLYYEVEKGWENMWDMLPSVLLNTAVIAAALAAIANVIIALMNNRRLRSIDNDKRRSGLIQYRYAQLFSILEAVESEQGFENHVNNIEKTFLAAIQKRQHYVELYHLARPLIESKMRNSLDMSANLEDRSKAV